MLVSVPQFLTTLGICLGYFTCYGSAHIQSSLSWRLPYIVQVLTATALAGSCWLLPDSPRWLVLHNRRDEALRSIERLGIMRAEAEKDILRVPDVVVEASKTSVIESLMLIFRRQYRQRTMLSLFVLGMMQLSGIDGILYVSLHPGYGFLPLHYQPKHTPIVCPASLPTSRPPRTDRRLPRQRRLGHPHAHHYHSRRSLRRPSRPEDVPSHRRGRTLRIHDFTRVVVRIRQCEIHWRREVARRGAHFRLCISLLRLLGRKRQTVRVGDFAG